MRSYTDNKIKPVATVTLPVKFNENEVNTVFELIDFKHENVISGEKASALGLIAKLSKLSTSQNNVDQLLKDYPEINQTTGTLPGNHTIKIQPGAQGVVHSVRRQPPALKKKIIDKLKEMESLGQITPVQEPTEWVSSMVAVLKGDKVCVCIDPSDLNKVILREHYPMRTVEDVVSDIQNAKMFSVLDAKSVYLQIELDEKSSFLTTFNTPIGRFRWLRLPFGIKSAPEIFQKIMDKIDGAIAIVDDILIAGTDRNHHDQILRQVTECATKYNLKLNLEKCNICQKSVSYVGHLLTQDGLRTDPAKVKAVHVMQRPEDKQGVKRFLGFVTYLSKFIPRLSEIDSPLR